MMTEAAQIANYKAVRERLYGRPNAINKVVEEQKSANAIRKAERRAWEKRREETERLLKLEEKSRLDIVHGMFERGTSERFTLDCGVAYWCFDATVPTGLKPIIGMRRIALYVLQGYPGITLDDLIGERRYTQLVDARRAVVLEIRARLPHISAVQIGNFLHKHHTAIFYMLGMIKKKGRQKT